LGIAKADAEKAAAEAAARAAQAETDKAIALAAAEIKRLEILAATKKAEDEARERREREQREADERAAQNSVGSKAFQLGMNVTAAAGGYVLGKQIAGKIEKRHVDNLKVRKAQTAILAPKAQKIIDRVEGGGRFDKAKLKAIVSTAREQKLLNARGPIGAGSAAILLVEGAASRYLAGTLKNETAAEAFRAVSTASLFAAASLVGDRVISNATPSVVPDAGHQLTLRTAQTMVAHINDEEKSTKKAQAEAKKAGTVKVPAKAKTAATEVAAKKVAPAKITNAKSAKVVASLPVGPSSPVRFAAQQVGSTMKAATSVAGKSALTVTGLTIAAFTAYSGTRNAAEASGMGPTRAAASGLAAAGGALTVGGTIAYGTNKAINAGARGLARVATSQSAGVAGRVAAKVGLRAIPYVGTALLAKDVYDAGKSLFQNNYSSEKVYAQYKAHKRAQVLENQLAKSKPIAHDAYVNAHMRKLASGKVVRVSGYANAR
jgi:hypothetical protein